MGIEKNDPKLTAFALGELDETEQAAIQTEVERSPALRQAVDEIRETAGLLTKELQGEARIGLSKDQRQAIEATAVGAALLPMTLRAEGGLGCRLMESEPRPQGSDLHTPQGIGTTTKTNSTGSRRLRRYWIPASLAASVVVIVGAGYSLIPRTFSSLSRARELGPSGDRLVCAENAKGINRDIERTALLSEESNRAEYKRRMAPTPGDGTVVAKEGEGRGVDLNFTGGGLATLPPALYSHNVFLSLDPRENGSNGYQVPFAPGPNEAGAQRLAGARSTLGWVDSVEAGRLRMPPDGDAFSTEAFDAIVESPFLAIAQHPLSTFSIDVDTASYSIIRRILNEGALPPPGAVRIEEMVNYFTYDYPQPMGDHPFSVNVEVADCPWNGDHRLARIGIKGMEFAPDERPPANLVFLIDVSGSMQGPTRLPLVKESLKMLTGELSKDDSVAMVVYAGASGLVLPATSGHHKQAILAALDQLQAGGSTNGGAGIQLAYDTAAANFIEGGINRVILATDGDFNVGIVSQSDLIGLIEEKARSGVFLSVLGYGMGNLQDSTLEKLADKGNGNYAYIDSLDEAGKVLVDQIGGTLMTIAKDVKIQVEFNPAQVVAYRLVGYENRMLRARDFNDDTKDAGEIGAGHTVTALYEIVPVGVEVELPEDIDAEGVDVPVEVDPNAIAAADGVDDEEAEIDPLRYQTVAGTAPVAANGELMTVKLRYKAPDGDVSERIDYPVTDLRLTLDDSSDDFAFAAAVASFGMLLRGSAHAGELTYDDVSELASTGLGEDASGYRAEFIALVAQAKALPDARPAGN